MKTAAFILAFFLVTAVSAQAQETRKDNWPYWTLSKGVQKIQHRNVTFAQPNIKTGNGDWAISKGVAKMNAQKSDKPVGTVVLGGYPTWTISKGVARMQATGK